jgi:cell division protein FtsZ
MLKFENNEIGSKAIIKVIGVGGAGGNAVNTMIENDMRGMQFLAVDTDIKELRKCKAPEKLQIGANLTRGLGARANPQVGQRSAHEDRQKLQEIVSGAVWCLSLLDSVAEQVRVLLPLWQSWQEAPEL